MRGSVLAFALLLVGIFGCQNDFFPEGLYHYQVERLLSNDDAKLWLQEVNSSDCADSVLLLIETASGDSISISRLIRKPDCSEYDTTSLGNANASSFAGELLFTDSLNFANGDFWLISQITSKKLQYFSDNNTFNYRH